MNTSGPQQRISQGLGHNCKPDSDQAFHGTTHSELLSAGSTAPMMCAIPKGRSLSLDSSASKSGKLVCPSAGKYARSSSTFRAASDRAQLVRPVVSVKATASAGHSPPEKSQALLNGVASHTHHLTGDHKHLHHQLQTTLVAAHAVGYCNGIRHQAGQGSLIFSRHHVCSDLDCKPDCDQPQAQQPRLHTQHSAVPRPAPVADERLRQPVGISQHSLLPATDTRKRLPQRQQAWQQQQHHEQQQHHMQQQHVSQHQTQTLHQQTATAYPKLSLGRRSSDPHSGTHAQGQPSSPTAHSGEKRSRVISIAEASSEPHGRRPNPFIKIRCSQPPHVACGKIAAVRAGSLMLHSYILLQVSESPGSAD